MASSTAIKAPTPKLFGTKDTGYGLCADGYPIFVFAKTKALAYGRWSRAYGVYSGLQSGRTLAEQVKEGKPADLIDSIFA